MNGLESVVILASAGTGKTFALTNRFLALVLRGEAPERILAVTFTRAAAAEILDRLLRRLAVASSGDAAAGELARELASDTVPTGRLTGAACLGALRAIVGSLDRLRVGTIDAFFARVAGSVALELDLPPGWTVADDALIARLRTAAVERVLESRDDAEVLRLVRLLHRGVYSARVFGAVLRAVEGAYGAFLGAPPGAWGEIGPLTRPLDNGARDRAVGAVRALPVPTNADGRTPNKLWAAALAAHAEAAGSGRWDEFLAAGVAKAVADGKGQFSRVDIDDAVRAALVPLVEHARAVLLTHLREQNLATRDVLAEFDAEYTGVRRDASVCTFDDIPRALARADETVLRDLYYALDGRIDHVLIDEFQDTSATQFALFEPLISEIVSDNEGRRSLLCVGDAKQSLYQWRGAEPDLLGTLRTTWGTIVERSLDTSRRSTPEIIGAVNAVFGSIGSNAALSTPEAVEAARAWAGRFRPHGTARTAPGFAGLTVSPAPGERPAARAHFEHAARHIAGLALARPGESIGVLVPQRKSLALLLALLRGMDVDAAVESGLGVSDSPAVGAVLSLLRLADFPGNTAAAFHVGTSPLGPVVGLGHPAAPWEVDEVAQRVRRGLVERGYGATIAAWAGAVRGSCSARDTERLRALVALGHRFDARAGLRPSEFVEFVGAARTGESETAQVRLLTVHGSKGLEFDCVVLPDLEDGLGPGRNPEVVVERAGALEPITAVSRYAAGVVRAGHARLEAMHARQTVRVIDERLSVLYVAMTRARGRLDMIVRPLGASREWPRTLAGLVHHALAPDRTREPGATLWSSGESHGV